MIQLLWNFVKMTFYEYNELWRGTVLQDVQFAVFLKRENIFGNLNDFKQIFCIKYYQFFIFCKEKQLKIHKMCGFGCKNYKKILRKFKVQYLFLSATNWSSCSTVLGPCCKLFCINLRFIYSSIYNILSPSLYLFKHCIFDCCLIPLFKIRLYMKSSRVVHGLILMCTSMFLDNFVSDKALFLISIAY